MPTTRAKAQLKRTKNDVLDAQTIAGLAQALVPACCTPPPRIYHELHQRQARNARSADTPRLSITLHGLPATFARAFGFDLLATA